MRRRRWTAALSASAGSLVLSSACLLAPAAPGPEPDAADGGSPDGPAPVTPCAVSSATVDSSWVRVGDSFTRAEARTLSLWHQVAAGLSEELRSQLGGDGGGSGSGSEVYRGPPVASVGVGFERPQLLRTGDALVVELEGAPHELTLDASGTTMAPPRAFAVDPPLPAGVTVGGPSAGAAPRAIAARRAVANEDLVEVVRVDGAWRRGRTIPLTELAVTGAGAASLDASGGRIVFVGTTAAELDPKLLTSTRPSLEAPFAAATVVSGDYARLGVVSDPWLDDACRYLYVSSLTTNTVRRLVIAR